jgi:hypothetical protein
MGGYSTWPELGGVLDQSAWTIDAFGLLSATAAEWDEVERKRKQQR